jgi:hypothetical protein
MQPRQAPRLWKKYLLKVVQYLQLPRANHHWSTGAVLASAPWILPSNHRLCHGWMSAPNPDHELCYQTQTMNSVTKPSTLSDVCPILEC